MLMKIILVKLTLYRTEKCPIGKNSPFHPHKSKKKIPQIKNQTISTPYLLQAQPALVLQLFARFCSSAAMCRQNGNCVDPIHMIP